MSLSDFILPTVTVMMFSVQGVEVSRALMESRMPPPIEGAGYVDGPVVAGKETLVHWNIIKRIDCEGVNSRVWDGEDGFHLSEQVMATALPSTEAPRYYKIQTKIPEYAPPGELRLSIKGSYRCPGFNDIPFELGPVVMEVSDANK